MCIYFISISIYLYIYLLIHPFICNDKIALIQRTESVKNDHDQMQSGNQILQTYINNLMSSDVLSSVNGSKKEG